MYRPFRLKVKDFQSFESLSYDFQIGKAILIEGENKTDEGQATNGSGKSSFAEAIYYSLLGSSSTGKRDIKLVRKGCKQASLSLTLKNEYLKQELRIERVLFANSKSSTLDIFINGIDQKDRVASVNEGNKLILDLLDISADDLKNYYLINRKRFVSFFDSPDSSKRALLARFSNIDKIQQVAGNVDLKINDRQNKINSLNAELIAIDSRIELLKRQVEEAKSQSTFEQKKGQIFAEIDSCKARVKSIDKEVQEINVKEMVINKDIAKYEENLSQFNEKIKNLQSIDFDVKLQENSNEQAKMQEQIDKLREEKRNVIKEADGLNCDLQPILVMLQGLVVCPNCKTEFSIADKSFNPDEARQLVEDTQKAIDEMKRQAEELQLKIEREETSNAMKQLQEQRKTILAEKESNNNQILIVKKMEIPPITDKLGELARAINDCSSTRVNLFSEQATCEKKVKELERSLKELAAQTTNPDIVKWEGMIKEQETTKNGIEKEIDELDGFNHKDKLWKERINLFYVYLTNKTLAVIQSHCNHYLSAIGSDLNIQFEGFKTLADGKIKESINAVITREGQEEEDYRCFSGGEQGRLIFSTILTYQELINQRSKSGGLDFCCIDEILDAVDAQGFASFIHSLSSLDKTLFIVSQVKTDAPVENTLLIVKENGISRIYAE